MTTFKGTGIVWDKVNDCPLCKFVNGTYTTNNKNIITVLMENGFQTTSEIVGECVEIDVEVVEDEDVRTKAKRLGIKSWHNKKLDRLEAEIAEIEG